MRKSPTSAQRIEGAQLTWLPSCLDGRKQGPQEEASLFSQRLSLRRSWGQPGRAAARSHPQGDVVGLEDKLCFASVPWASLQGKLG